VSAKQLQPQDQQGSDEKRAGAQNSGVLPYSLGTTERRKLAHELRTSFGAILSRVDALLCRGMKINSEDRRNAYLKEIRLAATHALDIVEAAVTNTGNSADAPQEAEALTDLGKLVQQVFFLTSAQAQDAGVTLLVTPSPETIFICAQPAALRQILINIISNAIKFTPDGGKVHVCYSITEQTCVLTIQDSGIGIPPAELARIKNTGPRRGYGYDIATTLAAMYGAEFAIESQRNYGTTVSITLQRHS